MQKNNRRTGIFTLRNPLMRLLVIIFILIPVYYFLYKIYSPRVNAFGCFDDCVNFVGGYFIGRGRQLYSQIYFNHMPLMPYMSALIQQYGNPINMFSLVLQHRQVLFLFSFLFNILIVWRFGLIGLAFTILYEFTKFYVFGDRFLAEGFIVYPLVYLTGLGLLTLLRERIHTWEIIFSAVCFWFVVFMREPYVPVAVLLYGVIIRPVFFKKISGIAAVIVLVLTAGLFMVIPIRAFLFNVITVNLQRTELQPGNFFGTGIAKSFFYPVYLFITGNWNDFRIILITLSTLFFISSFVWIRKRKNLWVLGFIFVALGLANLRPTIPGLLYYESYHQIIWYGILLFSTLYLMYYGAGLIRKRYIFYIILVLIGIFVLFSPRSFIYLRVDRQTEFINNYGMFLQVSEVIKAISKPEHTLYTNGADEFLYVVSDRNSAYPYAFYYPSQYKDRFHYAAINMYRKNPPDIIYDFCSPDAPINPYIPKEVLPLYSQWYSEGKPTCLYIKKSLVPGLTEAQRTKAMEFLYYLPDK